MDIPPCCIVCDDKMRDIRFDSIPVVAPLGRRSLLFCCHRARFQADQLDPSRKLRRRRKRQTDTSDSDCCQMCPYSVEQRTLQLRLGIAPAATDALFLLCLLRLQCNRGRRPPPLSTAQPPAGQPRRLDPAPLLLLVRLGLAPLLVLPLPLRLPCWLARALRSRNSSWRSPNSCINRRKPAQRLAQR